MRGPIVSDSVSLMDSPDGPAYPPPGTPGPAYPPPGTPGPVDPAPQPQGQQPPPGPPPAGWGMKLFMLVVIVGFGAAGYGGIKTFLDTRSDNAALDERGVEHDAGVISVTEVSGRRIETYHRINVAWDPEGPDSTASAEVLDCSGNRYDSGVDSVAIVYLPDDTETVKLAACQSSFDMNIFPGIIGLVFGALALFIAWKTRKMWTE